MGNPEQIDLIKWVGHLSNRISLTTMTHSLYLSASTASWERVMNKADTAPEPKPDTSG